MNMYKYLKCFVRVGKENIDILSNNRNFDALRSFENKRRFLKSVSEAWSALVR